MELKDAKYVSMIVLLASNLIMTLIAIGLQRFVLQRNGNILSVTQRIISCLTSGILLGKLIMVFLKLFHRNVVGTLLMLILPNSLDLVAHQWHNINMGYVLIGLGFFVICIIKESIDLYEKYLSNERVKTEQEQLINSPVISNQDNQLTRLITLVFALGVHFFFSM
jgi:hypothetical protein